MTVRVAFRYDDTRWFARLVCWWTRSDTAHCEVAWAWNGTLHQCVSASFVDHGVRGKAIDLVPSKWRVYELDDVDPRAVVDWLRDHAGQGYDWIGLLGFVLRPIKGLLRLWFCSEAVGDATRFGDAWRFAPAEFEQVMRRVGRRI